MGAWRGIVVGVQPWRGVLLLVLSFVLLVVMVRPSAHAGGSAWTDPQRLSAKGQSLVGEPQTALGAEGYSIAGWTTGRNRPSRFRARAAVRLPGDTSFRRGVRIAGKGSAVVDVGIAEDEEVGIVVAWKLGTGFQARLHSPDGGFEPPSIVAPARISWIDFDVARDGTAVIAWGNKRGLKVRVREPGGDFGAPIRITEDGRVDYAVSATAGGGVAVAWQRSFEEDKRVFVSARYPGDAAFAAPEPAPRTAPRFASSVTMTEAGDVVLLTEDHSRTFTIAASEMEPGGPFGNPVAISNGRNNFNAQVEADSSGRVVAGWERFSGGASGPRVATRSPGGGWSREQQLAPGRRRLVFSDLDVAASGATVFNFVSVGHRRQRVLATFAPLGGSQGGVERVASVAARTLLWPDVAANYEGEAITVFATNADGPGRVLASTRPAPAP